MTVCPNFFQFLCHLVSFCAHVDISYRIVCHMACEFVVAVKVKVMLTATHCLLYFTYLPCTIPAVCSGDKKQPVSQSPVTDSDSIDDIRDTESHDSDTDNDLDDSDVDAAEDNAVISVLQSAEQLTKAASTPATPSRQQATMSHQHRTLLPKTATMSNEFIVKFRMLLRYCCRFLSTMSKTCS